MAAKPSSDKAPSKPKSERKKSRRRAFTRLKRYPPECFFNRELSWLDFNERVLEEASNHTNPLLERVRFIAISASNLDEFFMKRIGGLRRQLAAGVTQPSRDGRTAAQQLDEIGAAVRAMIATQRDVLTGDLLPKMHEQGIKLVKWSDLNRAQKAFAKDYYERKLFPALTPLGVGPAHPFPLLSNQSLSLAVLVGLHDGEEPHFARVKVPSNRPRFLRIRDDDVYLPLEELILAHLDTLFPGAQVLEAAPFTVTRNADVQSNEEEAEDLLDMIHEELRDRRFAPIVRLMVNQGTSARMLSYLKSELNLTDIDVYLVNGLLRLSDLSFFPSLDRPELKFPSWQPLPHPRLRDPDTDIFKTIAEGDLLVHHPYQSFRSSVLKLLEQAANDPKVLAIKQTLYRTAENSPIVKTLIRAAENGKQVAVLVEIKARFDEANNLHWVRELEEAGCHVTYGVVGLKTHTKILTVVRDEDDRVRLYTHIGTGNYHTGTANLYTDVGYFSTSDEISEDATQLFNMLTGYSVNPAFKRVLVAPINMREGYIQLIRNEAEKALNGDPARIVAKMNQLEDAEMIAALYEAGQAGVQIDLIVRGFCSLRPGMPGVSDNIRVRSIVGRFLEHSRVFHFQNGGPNEFLIGSADWMRRNLSFRVELAAPVTDPAAKQELRELLEGCLADTTNAWDLHADGKYVRVAASAKPVTSQYVTMEKTRQTLIDVAEASHHSKRLHATGTTAKVNKPKG